MRVISFMLTEAQVRARKKTQTRRLGWQNVKVGDRLRGVLKAIMPAPSIDRDSVIEAARGEHSVKPEDSYTLIERVSPGPRAELFSRRPRDGWDVWGNDPAVSGEPALVELVRGVLG